MLIQKKGFFSHMSDTQDINLIVSGVSFTTTIFTHAKSILLIEKGGKKE